MVLTLQESEGQGKCLLFELGGSMHVLQENLWHIRGRDNGHTNLGLVRVESNVQVHGLDSGRRAYVLSQWKAQIWVQLQKHLPSV
jgi:hypothetical protein